jgi:Na+/H+ antiporter NhaD/arsenite permease-like protein/CBS domain-containing protein
MQILATAVASALLLTPAASFTPSSFLSSPYSSTNNRQYQQVVVPSQISSSSAASTTALSSDLGLAGECLLTPEGYGFSATAERIIAQAKRGNNGFYMATASSKVIDVMAGITGGTEDVALIYEGTELLGIFTESDYIDFSQERAKSASEAESAAFLIAPVKEYITPTSKLVSVSAEDTANQAITLMQQNSLRHVIVADSVTNNRLNDDSTIVGVISMQDVMSLVQKDERLSLESLQKKFPGLNDPLSQMREEIKSQANALANDPETAKKDLIRTGTAALSVALVGTFLSGTPWLYDHADWAMIGIFILGYIGIIFEEVFEFNKAAIALLMSTGMWVTYADYYNGASGIASETVKEQLGEQLAEVSDICFFLLAASTIVEVVDAHQGFKVVTNQITTKSKKGLFWVIGFLTFFLSAILNNLTVTIVMCSLLKKLVPVENDRKLFGAMVVVAANAGGVWTPIGDVTTTMLWINHNLSTIPTVTELFIPSIVCLVASLSFLVNQVEEDSSLAESTLPEPSELATRGKVVFGAGIASLLAVPVFAEFTGLPPYIAMLTGLGAMWTLTDIIHMGEEEEDDMKVPAALSKLDTSGILFFLGILMSIGVLDKSGLLKDLAIFLNENLPSQDIIATVIGIASALIDNVPLVAATMGMYDITEFGTDDKLWQLIALCAGTGGSILVIGSASGVALMGLEKVDFIWYAKKVSIGAAIGYFAGIATYLAQNALLHGGGLFNDVVPQATAAVDMMTGIL